MSNTPPNDPHGYEGRPDDGDEPDGPQTVDSRSEGLSDDVQQAGWGQPRPDPAHDDGPQPWQGGQTHQATPQPWQGGQPHQATPWQREAPSGAYLPGGPVPGGPVPGGPPPAGAPYAPARRSRATAVWVSVVAVLVVALVALGLRFAFATGGQSSAEGQTPSSSTTDPSEDSSAAPTQPSAPADPDAGSGATAAEVQREVDSLLREYPLPARVDSITELTDIQARGRAILYVYTIASSVDSASMSETTARRTITKSACSDPGMRALMEDGVTLQYRYVFASDQHTFDFDVTAAGC